MGNHEIDYLQVSTTAQNHSNFPIARVEHIMEEINTILQINILSSSITHW